MTKPFIFAFAGYSGSGKTTVVDGLVEDEVGKRLRSDDYYREREDVPYLSGTRNYDTPGALHLDLLCAHLRTLKEGEPILKPVYSKKEHARKGELERFEPADVILLDGMLLLCHEGIRRVVDFSIWVDIPIGTIWDRRKGRQPDYDERYHNDVLLPMAHEHVEPFKGYADASLNGMQEQVAVLASAKELVRSALAKR